MIEAVIEQAETKPAGKGWLNDREYRIRRIEQLEDEIRAFKTMKQEAKDKGREKKKIRYLNQQITQREEEIDVLQKRIDDNQ